jgi:Lrp/AsnC family leucine-responsive transcriptional regulator
MSERNTGYQFVSTDTEAVESLLISIYEKITGVSSSNTFITLATLKEELNC